MSRKHIVLAAVDLEAGSSRVIDAALEYAAAHWPSELHVLAVAEPIPFAMVGMVPPPVQYTSVDMERMEKLCRERVDAMIERSPNQPIPKVDVHSTFGAPADEIVWFGAHLDCDALFVGTHGRKGIKRLLIGSVAEKVVRLAGCPVYVVREKNHRAEWRVPEIEPVCPECAQVRASSNGEKLWCARHSEHHVRAHVYSAGPGGDQPSAWTSSTGTV
ncbi:MAG: universal stress protein [Polyangiaceae bacterium]